MSKDNTKTVASPRPTLMRLVIRTFGLRGSWKWACKQMDKGRIVKRSTDSGAAHYKIDHENQRRIVWSFTRKPKEAVRWESANIFLADFEYVSWVCV